MATYYLDIETTGLDPKSDKIITIQYRELERGTGRPAGPLTILKEWEAGGEAKILQKFVSDTHVTSRFPFDFIPVGNNLKFEHSFLSQRSKRHGLKKIDIMSRPALDIQTTLILMNYGEFKGSGLDKMTGKKQSGSKIMDWYELQKYKKIEDYITNEADSFAEFYAWMLQNLPILHKKFSSKLK